jgi:hypothetical protein
LISERQVRREFRDLLVIQVLREFRGFKELLESKDCKVILDQRDVWARKEYLESKALLVTLAPREMLVFLAQWPDPPDPRD